MIGSGPPVSVWFVVRRGRWRGAGCEETWERAAMLTKPLPPAWTWGDVDPEYFMTPPSSKRLQNWAGSIGEVCSLKVGTWSGGWEAEGLSRQRQKQNNHLKTSTLDQENREVCFYVFLFV